MEKKMTNNDLADVFDHIANLLEIKGELVFKTLAYRRAAETLRSLPEDIHTIMAENRLQEIPGVGKAIADKITELLTTGSLRFLETLEQEVPPTLETLLEVPDVGPKKAALFWKELGIINLAGLEAAARAGQLRNLPSMGAKSEERILAGLAALARRSKRMLLGNARPLALRWLAWLKSQPGVEGAEVAGSLRRWKSTIGDLDLVAASRDPKPLMEAFIHHPDVVRIAGQGENKSSIELSNGINLQIWVQPPERFGTLLQFVSGSKDHNVRLRELAQKQGLSLSEQSILRPDGSEILCTSEPEVYAALGLPWIPPELREDRGEIQAALAGRLPELIQTSDLTADLHNHTSWSDGVASIEEMAMGAIARGLKVLAITDHSGGLSITGGLSVERLYQQRLEINAIQTKLGNQIHLLQGAEVEIRADGSLDYPDKVLDELDIVVASLHISLRQPREQVTARLLNAIRNPYVDIIGHPSGRLLGYREGADLDWEQVLPAARDSGVALEINANPSRLDLDEVYARRAAEMGIPIAINTDSHAPDQFDLAEYGVSVARRAWLSPQKVITTWQPQQITEFLKRKRA
jgi:DNA polymerase (family 10)